jgi:uncharacterized protein YraI
MNTLKCSLLSASILALSTGWAAAAPAVVLDWLNLRAGPGYDNYIVSIIPAGWIIEAGGCSHGWCAVNVNGIPGYVDANYLAVPTPAGYAWGWAYPSYAYYYGYLGAPYAGYAGYGGYGGYAGYANGGDDYYARGTDTDVKAARRVAVHGKHTTVAKGPVPTRFAALANTGGPTKSDRNKSHPRG